MIFGLGGRIAAFLAVLLVLTGWVAKHYMLAAHDAEAAAEQAREDLASLHRQHVEQIKTLEDEHADEVSRLRLEASILAAIAAADAYAGADEPPVLPAAGKPHRARQAGSLGACAGSPVMLALFDGLRSAGSAGGAADPGGAAPVRRRPSDSPRRSAAPGPSGRRVVPR